MSGYVYSNTDKGACNGQDQPSSDDHQSDHPIWTSRASQDRYAADHPSGAHHHLPRRTDDSKVLGVHRFWGSDLLAPPRRSDGPQRRTDAPDGTLAASAQARSAIDAIRSVILRAHEHDQRVPDHGTERDMDRYLQLTRGMDAAHDLRAHDHVARSAGSDPVVRHRNDHQAARRTSVFARFFDHQNDHSRPETCCAATESQDQHSFHLSSSIGAGNSDILPLSVCLAHKTDILSVDLAYPIDRIAKSQ